MPVKPVCSMCQIWRKGFPCLSRLTYYSLFDQIRQIIIDGLLKNALI